MQVGGSEIAVHVVDEQRRVAAAAPQLHEHAESVYTRRSHESHTNPLQASYVREDDAVVPNNGAVPCGCGLAEEQRVMYDDGVLEGRTGAAYSDWVLYTAVGHSNIHELIPSGLHTAALRSCNKRNQQQHMVLGPPG